MLGVAFKRAPFNRRLWPLHQTSTIDYEFVMEKYYEKRPKMMKDWVLCWASRSVKMVTFYLPNGILIDNDANVESSFQ